MPKTVSKRNYRQRAHANPFKDVHLDVPNSPESIDWQKYFKSDLDPEFVDIGCGYGKFLLSVAEKNTNINILGIEIRDKVHDFVLDTIKEKNIPNAGIMKTNAFIFLPNIFKKNQLSKIFVLFPDPHFKKRKQKGRIICKQILEVFNFIMKNKGRLYISTDVKGLFDDMCDTIKECSNFIELTEKDVKEDSFYEMTFKSTDEALRAGVKTGKTYATIFELNK